MRTIALIEDDRDLQELLRYRLQREGYRLATSGTGRDAIEFLLRAQPALLLLDIMLPHTRVATTLLLKYNIRTRGYG